MKTLNRNLTTTEKLLVGVLVLILLGLLYYKLVDERVRNAIAASDSEYQSIQTDLDATQKRIDRLQAVQDSMSDLEANDKLSWMASYNNSEAEVAFLNDILADTLQYSVTFANVTRTGDQIRRSFSLQYKTQGYKAARDIMVKLLEGENRCLVGDAKCNIYGDGTVTMNQSATFFETMVGGTPDAGLPRGSAKQD